MSSDSVFDRLPRDAFHHEAPERPLDPDEAARADAEERFADAYVLDAAPEPQTDNGGPRVVHIPDSEPERQNHHGPQQGSADAKAVVPRANEGRSAEKPPARQDSSDTNGGTSDGYGPVATYGRPADVPEKTAGTDNAHTAVAVRAPHRVPEQIEQSFRGSLKAMKDHRNIQPTDKEKGWLTGEGVVTDSTVVAVTCETLAVRHDRQTASKDVELAHGSNVALRPDAVRDLVKKAQRDLGETGMSGAVANAVESRHISSRIEEAKTDLAQRFGDPETLSRRQRNRHDAALELRTRDVLREAGENKQWTVEWLNKKWSRFAQEADKDREGRNDHENFWKAMHLRPDEAMPAIPEKADKSEMSLREKVKAVLQEAAIEARADVKMSWRLSQDIGDNDVGDLKSVQKVESGYSMHLEADTPAETPAGAPLQRKQAYQEVLIYRIGPINEEYCKAHDGEVLAPGTLDRLTFAATNQYARERRRNAGRKSGDVDVLQRTADGLRIQVIDDAINLARVAWNEHLIRRDPIAYDEGRGRTAALHPDIALLTELKIALTHEWEALWKGPVAAMESRIEQIDDHYGEVTIIEQAAARLESGDPGSLVRGILPQHTGEQMRRKAEVLAMRGQLISQTVGKEGEPGGPEAARQFVNDEILARWKEARGRQAALNGNILEGAEDGAVDERELSTLPIDYLQGKVAELSTQLGPVETRAPIGDPLRNAYEAYLNAYIIKKREEEGGEAGPMDQQLLARQSYDRNLVEHARLYPEENSVLLIIGEEGEDDATALAALLTELGREGLIRKVSTEGLPLSDKVRLLLNRRSEDINRSGQQTEFHEPVDPPRHDLKHSLVIGLGKNPPIGTTARSLLNSLAEDGIGVFAAREGSGWNAIAEQIQQLIEADPAYKDDFMIQRVDSADITLVNPMEYIHGEGKVAYIFTRAKRVSEKEVVSTSVTYNEVLRRHEEGAPEDGSDQPIQVTVTRVPGPEQRARALTSDVRSQQVTDYQDQYPAEFQFGLQAGVEAVRNAATKRGRRHTPQSLLEDVWRTHGGTINARGNSDRGAGNAMIEAAKIAIHSELQSSTAPQ